MTTPRIVFYGDDFTGATDTLANAAQAGLRTVLFLGVPTPAQLQRAGTLDCIGIAGAARAMSPAEMRAELGPVGRFFQGTGARVLHYKTCSTFDSAPHVGSIGQAINTLRTFARNPFVPIVGGQPNLGRYCVFGNLFAAAGSGGTVYRIDRHPTMSRHPVTPMGEADLRQHLALQGLVNVAGVGYPAYARSSIDDQLVELLGSKPDAVLFDVAQASDLAPIGRAIWRQATRQPLLAVGPSSVVQALAAGWADSENRNDTSYTSKASAMGSAVLAAARGPVLVLAGSLSPITAQQVRQATSYTPLALDAARLTDAGYQAQTAAQAAALLRNGHSVLACTSSAEGIATAGVPAGSRALAEACGAWLARVLAAGPLRRVGIAGGDTSSLSVQALDAWGLSYLQPVAPGLALCRLHSDVPTLDGMEIVLKGGQMGPPDLFERLLHGAASSA